ncbi:phage/plasmid replication protein, II/X family [Solemya pervernicosa gill symbiont]|uniref:phage/plasmid replication protein, II/X family n=1 Tax=Solemya pervernicosa gill symbiont TaxID=642797 RepID=UPI0038B48584
MPCQHSEEVCGGRIVSFENDTGEVEWQTIKRLGLAGSHSNKIHLKTHDKDLLLVEGNPAKFLQGHNIFGSDDLIGLGYALYDSICNALGLEPTQSDSGLPLTP